MAVLRYDLTAPLARYVAENQQFLPTPFRSYRQGWVFRNEKPGPGRYRQFMQFDADTVGSASPAADAEVCMMAADTMEALGIPRGQYVLKVNNRKILEASWTQLALIRQDESRTAVDRATCNGQVGSPWHSRVSSFARQGTQRRERRFHQRCGT